MMFKLKKPSEKFLEKYFRDVLGSVNYIDTKNNIKVDKEILKTFPMIFSNYIEFENEYMNDYYNHSLSIEKINGICESLSIENEELKKLALLILMPPNIFGDLLENIKYKLSKFETKEREKFQECFDTKYKNLRNRNISDEYVRELNILMCPYCNMDDISIKDKRDKENDFNSKYQLDHFISKSDYPVFALSIFNLIPCCQKCNHTKGKKDLLTNPYIELKSKIKFNLNTTENSKDTKLEIENKLQITIESDETKEKEKIKNDIDVLQLKGRYNTKYSVSKKEIVDLANLCIEYNSSYEELNKEYTEDFKFWKKSALRDGLIKEEEFGVNRLSKVKSDIVKIGLGEKEYNNLL